MGRALEPRCVADPGPFRSVAVPDQRCTTSALSLRGPTSTDLRALALHRIRDTRVASRDLALRQPVEMRQHILDVHHVGIFVMQVEQIDLVADRGAVVGAFLHDDVVEAV